MLRKYLHCLIVVSLVAAGVGLTQPGQATHFKAAQGPKVAKTGVSSANYEKPQPAPVSRPSVAPTPPVQVAGANYEALVKQYDWNADVALAIMRAESQCNANAVSPPNWDGLRDYGLMQLHGVDILDPAQNVAYAYYNKYLKGGWSHWTTYTSGKYLNYLSEHC